MKPLSRMGEAVDLGRFLITEAVAWRCSVKKVFLKFIGKHRGQCLLFQSCRFQTCNCIKRETPTRIFFCEFCKICTNSFLQTPPVAASVLVTKSSTVNLQHSNFQKKFFYEISRSAGAAIQRSIQDQISEDSITNVFLRAFKILQDALTLLRSMQPPCRYIQLFLYTGALALNTCHKQPPEVYCEKNVLKNFAKFTGIMRNF